MDFIPFTILLIWPIQFHHFERNETNGGKIEEFKFKNRYIHVYQSEIFAIKAAENYKESDKKICHIFHHNFKNIPCYVMSELLLARFYFVLFDDGLTLKTLKMAFIGGFFYSNSSIVYSALCVKILSRL